MCIEAIKERLGIAPIDPDQEYYINRIKEGHLPTAVTVLGKGGSDLEMVIELANGLQIPPHDKMMVQRGIDRLTKKVKPQP